MRTTSIAAHRESCAGDWLIAVREHGLPARLPPALYCRDGIGIDSLRWDPKKNYATGVRQVDLGQTAVPGAPYRSSCQSSRPAAKPYGEKR